ncbi:MAG: chromosome segregation protein SMC [Dorea sp.]|nr:chromosome segregation protein SMC [Dorea sp.]
MIERAKELPVLYESDAKDSITIYLRNEEISASEDSDALLQAGEILSLFRECGWLLPREIGRNGEYVVDISTDCRRFMDFLRRMTEKADEGEMSNRIFAMYDIIRSAFDEDSVRRERPYTNILLPLLNNETELKNELTDLKNSIAGIMKAVIAFQDINSFGQFIIRDEMLDHFFREYFFIKNNGLIPAQLSYIKGKLRVLRQGEMCDKMIRECSEMREMSYEAAQERVEKYFAELQHFLSVEYESNMEMIDSRINTYYNLANTRIMLMAGNGIRLEAVLHDFLTAVSKLPEDERDTAMEKAADCARVVNQKYIGYKSFEKNRRAKNEGENIGLAAEELSEEEKAAQTEHLFQSAPNRFSVERVSNFLDVQLGNEKKISIKEKKVHRKEEILMYAAAMVYARNKEFPYDVQLSEEMVETEAADITNVTVSRR